MSHIITSLAGGKIAAGDLCFRYNGFIYSVADGDTAYNWVKLFLGVALSAVEFDGLSDPKVTVATSGTFELLASGVAVGDYVTADYTYHTNGPSDSDTYVCIHPQRVCVSSEGYSIGRAVMPQYYGVRSGYALIKIKSRA